MKALVLGCGEMGLIAIEDLVTHGVFGDVAVAARSRARVEDALARLPRTTTRLSAHGIDVHDTPALVALMRRYNVVCNMAGPNYRNAVAVARAAIGAGVPLVDVSDDWAATLDMLALHDDAVAAGTTIILGLGASPGVTNVLARHGANRLDRVDEVRTAWVMRGSDLGGPALCAHLLYSLPGRAFVFEDGEMREVRAFEDGREVIDFPVLGPVEVTHIGHPEPFTLGRYIEGVRYADDKAAFLPAQTSQMIVELARVARSGTPARMNGEFVDPMELAAASLHAWGQQLADVPTTGAIRAEVRGELDGRPARIIYSAAGRISIGTGVPAAIGAQLLAIGLVKKAGVWPPEACLEPEWFLSAVDARKVGEVQEQVIQA
jgi:saccharopine dehydrogenase-like NADP-dependent oxidoreductase